jgi:hypothetical protein
MFTGETDLCMTVCQELEELSGGDPRLGARVSGFSPLLIARMVALRAAGYAGDPARFLLEHPAQKQLAADFGFPEMINWFLPDELWFACKLGRGDGALSRARAGIQRAELQPALSKLAARMALQNALANDGDWAGLLDESQRLVQDVRETRVGRIWEPIIVDHIAVAQLELGRLREARSTAAEGVEFSRRNGNGNVPHVNATLARVQLTLDEPAADVEVTLADCEVLIATGDYRMLEGTLHELRATLAERAGDRAAHTAALERALETYKACGMTPAAEQVAQNLGD